MSSERSKEALEFERLKLALADEFMSMSEHEVREEAAAEGLTAEEAEHSIGASLRRAQYEVARRRAAVKGAGLDAAAQWDQRVAALDGARARVILQEVIKRRQSTDSRFLMAARREQEVPDIEIKEMLQELLELGLLSEDDLR